ncbi:hypothetical protein KJ632_03990 [Patescibacteria group bacterium]|nr:hypothetical protein [Patescibacteria group bacterium]
MSGENIKPGKVTPEVQKAALELIARGVTSEIPQQIEDTLQENKSAVLTIMQQLQTAAGMEKGAQYSEKTGEYLVRTLNKEQEPLIRELEVCLNRLKEDFDNGIVEISNSLSIDKYQMGVFKWKEIEQRLMDKGYRLLKKASKMVNGGRLIGVYPDGKICIADRSRKGLRLFFNEQEEPIMLDLSQPDSREVLKKISKKASPATYEEIYDFVVGQGYKLPAAPTNELKRGEIAACEFITREAFIDVDRGFLNNLAVLFNKNPENQHHLLANEIAPTTKILKIQANGFEHMLKFRRILVG